MFSVSNSKGYVSEMNFISLQIIIMMKKITVLEKKFFSLCLQNIFQGQRSSFRVKELLLYSAGIPKHSIMVLLVTFHPPTKKVTVKLALNECSEMCSYTLFLDRGLCILYQLFLNVSFELLTFGFGATISLCSGLISGCCSRITPGRLWGPYGELSI